MDNLHTEYNRLKYRAKDLYHHTLALSNRPTKPMIEEIRTCHEIETRLRHDTDAFVKALIDDSRTLHKAIRQMHRILFWSVGAAMLLGVCADEIVRQLI
jgi:hypothetical protein